MQHLRALVTMFAALFFVASPLVAQDYWGRGGLEIGAYYGVWNGLGVDAEEFEGSPDPVLLSLGNNDYYGGRLGYVFPFGLGIEGYFARLAGADVNLPRGGSNVNGLNFGGDLLYHFQPETAFQIFIAAGAGRQKIEIFDGANQIPGVDEYDETEFAWNYGAGVKLFLARNLALRGDWRNYIAPDGLQSARELFNNTGPGGLEEVTTKSTTWTAGLSYFLGGPSDEDGDGVSDTDDLCPGTPSGVDVDGDGCPFDDDGDGVYNYMDDCPDTPAGAAVDAAGCPTDADGDGVFDGLDQCPDTPAGATVGADGCPTDADGDGVFDGIDTCPNTPAGATVDESGCPMDSDGDGVFDGIDKCPGTPEGREVDAEGCGEFEAALAEGRLIIRDVNFAFNSAALAPGAQESLDRAAVAIRNAIANRPGMMIEVQGHTDAIGSDRYNQGLSERRAASVRDYIVGIEPSIASSLTTRGYGESQPVASNDNDAGRAENRRVEFVVSGDDQ
jgi:OOP family OmpA-OmpF porin